MPQSADTGEVIRMCKDIDDKTLLRGRPAMPGNCEGLALVCPNSIMGWNGVDMDTGVIVEKGHPHEGESIKDRILVIPGSRGSIGWSDYFYGCHLHGCGPVAYVLTAMDSKCGTAIVMSGVPCVCDFPNGQDPWQLIHSGDRVRVDGDLGTVKVLPKP